MVDMNDREKWYVLHQTNSLIHYFLLFGAKAIYQGTFLRDCSDNIQWMNKHLP